MKIFIDTEFTDFINQDLISIGAVAENGETFYGENAEFKRAWSSQFVKDNIYPLLNLDKFGMRRVELASRLWAWMEEFDCDITIVVDYLGDSELLNHLFQDDHPKIQEHHLIKMVIWNKCANYFLPENEEKFKLVFNKMTNAFKTHLNEYFLVTGEHPHHSLSDAKANREAYLRVFKDFQNKVYF